MKLDINNYPESKNGSGVVSWLINHVPKSNVYFEMFGGSGVFGFELAKCVEENVYIFEKSEQVYNQLYNRCKNLNIQDSPGAIFLADSITHIKHRLNGQSKTGDFYYFDPPYLFDSRKSKRNIYEHEWNEQCHKDFLGLLDDLSAKGAYIMVSHYPNDLYSRQLKDWYQSEFQTMTRGGVVTEKIWMNYDIAQMKLATTKHIGKNFTDRQRIFRKINRTINKINGLPLHERQAIVEAINSNVKIISSNH